MTSEHHKRAIERIKPEDRAFMVKSLGVLSRIHFLMEKKEINRTKLATAMGVDKGRITKMLKPGQGLTLKTLVRLELIFGESVIDVAK